MKIIKIIFLLCIILASLFSEIAAQGVISGPKKKTESITSTTSRSTQSSKKSSPQTNNVPTERIQVGNITIEMVLVDGEKYNRHDEELGGKGVYSVKPFMISKLVITESLWNQLMVNDKRKELGSNIPADCNWDAACRFIMELNHATGRSFRLPTELEWEYAASGGKYTHGYKYAGSNNLNNVGWHGGTIFHPVGKKNPNELGIYDMSGNIFEWTSDYVPKYKNHRIIKGGQVNYHKGYCEITERLEPWFDNSTGIRLVLDI